MENKQTEMDELSAKVMQGLKIAMRKLVETNAAENRSLVIKVHGEIKHVPAKELLLSLPK